MNGVTSSIFRNERQYLQSNELFHRSMDGSGQMPTRQHPQQRREKKRRQHESKAQSKIAWNNERRVVEQGVYLDGEALLEMQNRLLQHSTNIHYQMNKHVRIRTYRTSI